MSKKIFLKIICCMYAVLLTRVDVGAFSFFSKNDEPNLEKAKSFYDASIENLEESKAQCRDLFVDLDSILSETENSRAEFKMCLERVEEQFQKLNDAYTSWVALGYPIKGEEYDVYIGTKNEFEKVFTVYRLKKEAFKSCCKKLEVLFDRDSKVLAMYQSDMNNSINLYYNYGIVLAKNNSTKV